MKKQVLLSALLIGLFTFTGKAQYYFSYFTSTYNNVTGGTDVFASSAWDDTVHIAATPYPITVDGETFNYFFIDSNGNVGFTYSLLDVNDIGTDTIALVMPLGGSFVETFNTDLVSIPGTSQVNLVTTGNVGNRILTVEWNNVSSYYDPTTVFNFQALFYEVDGAIEFRYGASSNPSFTEDGPYIGIARFSFATGNIIPDEKIMVGGTPAAPVASDGFPTFSTIPNPNTVFRFATTPNSVKEDGGLQFGLYPNPSNGLLFVNPAKADAYTIELFDQTGKTVVTQANLKGQQTISLDGLANGLYMARISTNGKQTTKRVVLAK
ncbi:MAG: T9SS type A sorting domain-containing protein [Sphingobacteriales bacterium JAD_PAG50586_3]|nr:MAG: T9SS type A sorting domain-containing protein [Sphingobacteriales bacterium JAD_PAG50586_3]